MHLPQVQKEMLHMAEKAGENACPGRISGADFSTDGTILYLTCHGGSLVFALDAVQPSHPIVAAFPSGQRPEGLKVDK